MNHTDILTFINTDTLLIVTAVLVFINILVSIFVRRRSTLSSRQLEDLEDMLRKLGDSINNENFRAVSNVKDDINKWLSYDANENRNNRREISDKLEKSIDKIENTLKVSLSEMQDTNRQKIDEIRNDVNRKLDTSLNERLDKSFAAVGTQLGELYKTLGEISKLEDGVNTLNSTLSNVKSRGVFGEMQLEHILSDILPGTLYDRNVVTRKTNSSNREAVEFAVRIPDKETEDEFMYLPIDSKFPATYYDRIVEASEHSDNEELRRAVKELEQRVKNDARDIRDKYLDPPHTTDFGIMFLPTESLYAEVLRISGLVEYCQREMHVVITGPSTMAALLNSLSIGFRYMAVNRNSKKVLKLLSAIKSQYATLTDLIGKAESRIELAKKATDELHKRTDLINKRLASVEAMNSSEADRLLGVLGAGITGNDDTLAAEADELMHTAGNDAVVNSAENDSFRPDTLHDAFSLDKGTAESKSKGLSASLSTMEILPITEDFLD